MARRSRAGVSRWPPGNARLRALIEEAIVDAYNESEQRTAFYTMLDEHLDVPFDTKLLGAAATIERIDMTNDDQRDRLTMHILRHTCASRLVQRGVDLYVVMKWIGHSDIRQTQRYAKLAPKPFAGALAALEQRPQVAAPDPRSIPVVCHRSRLRKGSRIPLTRTKD